jgi:enterochelin esterase-like enzyme
VLGGSSYGAGAALYALIDRPASFDGLLLESPSIYAGDYGLLKDAQRVRAWPRRGLHRNGHGSRTGGRRGKICARCFAKPG